MALVTLDVRDSSVVGLAVAQDLAHVLYISEQSSEATVMTYNIGTGGRTTHTLDCTSLTDSSGYSGSVGSAGSSTFRFLSASDDGMLVVMCGTAQWQGAYTFYTMDTATYTAQKLHADIATLNIIDPDGTVSNGTVSSLANVFVRQGYAYFSSSEPAFNLIEVDLSAQPTSAPTAVPTIKPSASPTAWPTNAPPPPPPTTTAPTTKPTPAPTAGGPPPAPGVRRLESQLTTFAEPPPPQSAPNWVMQPIRNLGKHPGVVPTRGFGATIYMMSTDAPYTTSYYNTTSEEFGQYTDLRGNLFFGVSVEVGYSFGICNGAIFNKTGIDPLTSSSFHDACDSING
jgi:hypothetical protein